MEKIVSLIIVINELLADYVSDNLTVLEKKYIMHHIAFDFHVALEIETRALAEKNRERVSSRSGEQS